MQFSYEEANPATQGLIDDYSDDCSPIETPNQVETPEVVLEEHPKNEATGLWSMNSIDYEIGPAIGTQ